MTISLRDFLIFTVFTVSCSSKKVSNSELLNEKKIEEEITYLLASEDEDEQKEDKLVQLTARFSGDVKELFLKAKAYKKALFIEEKKICPAQVKKKYKGKINEIKKNKDLSKAERKEKLRNILKEAKEAKKKYRQDKLHCLSSNQSSMGKLMVQKKLFYSYCWIKKKKNKRTKKAKRVAKKQRLDKKNIDISKFKKMKQRNKKFMKKLAQKLKTKECQDFLGAQSFKE